MIRVIADPTCNILTCIVARPVGRGLWTTKGATVDDTVDAHIDAGAVLRAAVGVDGRCAGLEEARLCTRGVQRHGVPWEGRNAVVETGGDGDAGLGGAGL